MIFQKNSSIALLKKVFHSNTEQLDNWYIWDLEHYIFELKTLT